MKHIAKSISETIKIGKDFSKNLRPGDVIALEGNLGSGKTTFIKGIALGLGLKSRDEVTSPTFALMHIYPTVVPLYHFDLYRLETIKEVESIGLDEFLNDPSVVCCIEWAERAAKMLPKKLIRISFKVKGPKIREINIQGR